MLILSRRPGESIVIGTGENKIVVKLLDAKGGQLKLGIDAPGTISIHREEIYERIQKEQNAKIISNANPAS